MKKRHIVLIFVVLGTFAISLFYVDFRMVPLSEEAGLAQWGYPLPIVETGPFYAGYVGISGREGGRAYILSHTNIFDRPNILYGGIVANLVLFNVIGIIITSVLSDDSMLRKEKPSRSQR